MEPSTFLVDCGSADTLAPLLNVEGVRRDLGPKEERRFSPPLAPHHKTRWRGVTPAMAVRLAGCVWTCEKIAALLD